MATWPIVSAGCIISGGDVDRSVLSPNVRVHKWSKVEESILFHNVRIGRNAVVRRAILDKNVVVEDGAEVGVSREADLARGFYVSEAGITLYRVDTLKRLPDVTYVGVNGGMPDNPRPSLYQAGYRAALANKIDAPTVGTYTIAGKCCETGDILIASAELPEVERGDFLVVFNTGAYNFSMASNYNRLPRPAVVLVNDRDADLIVARQTLEDLLIGDLIPERLF